jgi:hypothetical protein
MGIETAFLVAAAGSALAAGGAIYSGQQQKQQLNQQADQAQADAEAAAAQSQVEAGKIRAAARKQQSAALAALAVSGVDVSTGTAEQIQSDIANRGEQDALTTILTGSNKKNSIDASAAAMRIGGDNAATAGFINAGSSLLSGASKIGQSGWRSLGIGTAPVVNMDVTGKGS